MYVTELEPDRTTSVPKSVLRLYTITGSLVQPNLTTGNPHVSSLKLKVSLKWGIKVLCIRLQQFFYGCFCQILGKFYFICLAAKVRVILIDRNLRCLQYEVLKFRTISKCLPVSSPPTAPGMSSQCTRGPSHPPSGLHRLILSTDSFSWIY